MRGGEKKKDIYGIAHARYIHNKRPRLAMNRGKRPVGTYG